MKVSLKQILLFALFLFSMFDGFSEQFENYKFLKITPEDIKKKSFELDSSADAIVLADVGITEMEGTSRGWFQVTQKRRCRIKILTKNGYSAANLKIELRDIDGYRDRIVSLKGSTFNLVNNEVVETKLTEEAVYTEKINKQISYKKISFPQVKEGSIIEFSYTFTTDNIFLFIPWTFQNKYPTLYSENRTSIPEFFNYTSRLIGLKKFDVVKQATSSKTYTVLVSENDAYGQSDRVDISSSVSDRQMIMLNVPGYISERFISADYNYLSKIVFQLNSYRFPNTPTRNTIKTWKELCTILLEDEEFGKSLYKQNGWLSPIVNEIIKESNTEEDKIKAIYKYLQKNFIAVDQYSIYLSEDLSKIYTNKRGSVTDINLLFIAMLNNANINATPVIVKRKQNGFPFPAYPFLEGYDYVICRTDIDSLEFLLDPSDKKLPIGQLKLDMFNGIAQEIALTGGPVNLSPNLIKEQSRVVFELSVNDNVINGNYTYSPGMYESYEIRNSSLEDYRNNLLASFNEIKDYKVDTSTLSISGYADIEEEVLITYKFSIPFSENNIIMNSLLSEGITSNPFLSNSRQLPFELAFGVDKTVVVSIQLPASVTIEEVPKSVKSVFNIDEGAYDFVVRSNQQMIQIKSKLQLIKTEFSKEESASLTDFYDMIINKNSEKIVLKK